jgi:hypothetical protein
VRDLYLLIKILSVRSKEEKPMNKASSEVQDKILIYNEVLDVMNQIHETYKQQHLLQQGA